MRGFVLFCFDFDNDMQVWNVAWSLDGTRLVAGTDEGRVIQVTNNNEHETVYFANSSVRTLFVALSLLIPGVGGGVRVQS